MQQKIGFHYSKNNHVQNALQQNLQNGLRNKQHYSVKYKCSTSKLRRLEASLLMHREDLQQSSLIQGAWLLKTAVLNHFIKSARLPLEINFCAAKLRVDGGALEEGVI